jgi:hypothetical protein
MLNLPCMPKPHELADKTPEEVAAMRATAWTKHLLKSAEYASIFAGMMAARRSYGVLYAELQRLLAAHIPEPDPLTEDLFVLSAAHLAARPFSEHELMQQDIKEMLLALATVVDAHARSDEIEVSKERTDREKIRFERPVPLGFRPDAAWCVEAETPVLPKSRPLVLVGPKGAVLYVLDRIVEAASAPELDHQAVRYAVRKPEVDECSHKLTVLGPSAWAGCADKRKGVAMVMGEHVMDRLSAPPDLLVVDDMAAAYTRGYLGRHAGASAGDANKAIFAWCKTAGCCLVGGVFDPDSNVTSMAYEQLRNFSYLRPVTVITEAVDLPEGKVRIMVGGYQRFDVAAEEISEPDRIVLAV